VIAQRAAITSVFIGSVVVAFPDGLLSESIQLDGQPLRDVVGTAAFLLSVNTGLMSLSLR
jgi:hypothetical protein